MSEFQAPSKRKPRVRLTQGDQITLPVELFHVLETEPSVWWRGKPMASAFLVGWQLRTILNSLKGGHFYRVNREEQKV